MSKIFTKSFTANIEYKNRLTIQLIKQIKIFILTFTTSSSKCILFNWQKYNIQEYCRCRTRFKYIHTESRILTNVHIHGYH